jgi:metal-sulfur cluster biosynthetic enzyme
MNETTQGPVHDGASPVVTKPDIMNVLKKVYDPEIQFNIVDLGLVYGVEIRDGGLVSVTMTLTAPGCPYGPELVQQVAQAVKTLRGVTDAKVEVVFTPPWGPERMSQEAKLELGFDV